MVSGPSPHPPSVISSYPSAASSPPLSAPSSTSVFLFLRPIFPPSLPFQTNNSSLVYSLSDHAYLPPPFFWHTPLTTLIRPHQFPILLHHSPLFLPFIVLPFILPNVRASPANLSNQLTELRARRCRCDFINTP